jgi:hypothetical protein
MSLDTRATTIAAATAQAGAVLDASARTPTAAALRPLLGFLDEARRASDDLLVVLLREGPAPTGSRQLDAFVSALAEHVALERGVKPPAWTQDPGRFLDQWWFPSGLPLPPRDGSGGESHRLPATGDLHHGRGARTVLTAAQIMALMTSASSRGCSG